ncbi:MAG: co-chaperone GroES [Patescibacteria group bacterium]
MAKRSKQKAKKTAPAARSSHPVQPLGDRVLVKREEKEDTKSPAGIIIPDTAEKEKSKRGVVIAVGPGKKSDDGKLIPITVKVGAKVYFNAGWDNEVKFGSDESEYFLVHESDILAVIY